MARERILLVEDNAMNRRVAEFLLKSRGYIVYEAGDGQEALELAKVYLPDLILMDLQLPGLDGFAATRIIKQDAATKDIPVVALTAYAMTGDAERAAEAGCDGYITKPINPDEFTDVVAGYLKNPPGEEAKMDRQSKPSAARRETPAAHRTRRGETLQDSHPTALVDQAELVWQTRVGTIGDAATALSHEVRNLLGALGTCIQIFRRNPQLDEADAELLDIIQTGSRRLNEIVAEFSVYRRSAPFHLQEVNLHDLIEENLALLERDEKRLSPAIVIRRNFDPSVGNVGADRDQLRVVLRNLFLNAVQAMENGGELSVETEKAGREIAIRVRDSGPGIPAAVLPKIFDPFYSTKSAAIGLGLASVRYIVEKHMGSVTVQNEPGTGTCFIVRLPIEPADGSG